MNNNLIIVQTANYSEKLINNKNADFLVFTPDIMNKLDSCNIKYKTIEDFYGSKEYSFDIAVFNYNVENLLTNLDNVCSPYTGFSYSYSGNALYFMVWMDNLFYLDRLVKSIKDKYDNIYLYSTSKPKKNLFNQLNYSELISRPSNGTVSFPLEKGLERSVGIIFYTLNLDFISDSNSTDRYNKFLFKYSNYYGRLQGYCERKCKLIKYSALFNLKRKKVKDSDVIFIAQDGYEVESIRRYLTDFTCVTPVPSLRYGLSLISPLNIESKLISVVLKKFISDEFDYLNEYVSIVFKSYHSEVVGRIEYFMEIIKKEIIKTKPKVLLFSMGTRDVFDMIVAKTSNDLGIPSVFFQHGGCLLFYKSWYSKYLELNSNIIKTFIVNSSEEVELSQHYGAKVFPMGSISRYEKIHGLMVKPTKEILFCTGPYEFTAYDGLLHNTSCLNTHKSSIAILSALNENLCSVDIKIHPVGQFDSYKYYSKISSNHKKTKIIVGRPIETMFKKYKVIIMTQLGTGVLTIFLSYNVPVILFIDNFDDLDISGMDKARQDLIDRCYIARNKSDLSKILSKYKKDGLHSKWSESFVNKYVYPVYDGNPGVNIANYIRSN